MFVGSNVKVAMLSIVFYKQKAKERITNNKCNGSNALRTKQTKFSLNLNLTTHVSTNTEY